jgi:hypothetical protein
MMPTREAEDTWYYPPIKRALEVTGLFTMEEYIRKRQNKLAVYVASHPILQICRHQDSYFAPPPHQHSRALRWWTQPTLTPKDKTESNSSVDEEDNNTPPSDPTPTSTPQPQLSPTTLPSHNNAQQQTIRIESPSHDRFVARSRVPQPSSPPSTIAVHLTNTPPTGSTTYVTAPEPPGIYLGSLKLPPSPQHIPRPNYPRPDPPTIVPGATVVTED